MAVTDRHGRRGLRARGRVGRRLVPGPRWAGAVLAVTAALVASPLGVPSASAAPVSAAAPVAPTATSWCWNAGSLAGDPFVFAGTRLSAVQVSAARTVVDVGLSRGITERGIRLALAAALQASGLDPSHRTSATAGLFDERVAARTPAPDAYTAALAFYRAVGISIPGYATDTRTDRQLLQVVTDPRTAAGAAGRLRLATALATTLMTRDADDLGHRIAALLDTDRATAVAEPGPVSPALTAPLSGRRLRDLQRATGEDAPDRTAVVPASIQPQRLRADQVDAAAPAAATPAAPQTVDQRAATSTSATGSTAATTTGTTPTSTSPSGSAPTGTAPTGTAPTSPAPTTTSTSPAPTSGTTPTSAPAPTTSVPAPSTTAPPTTPSTAPSTTAPTTAPSTTRATTTPSTTAPTTRVPPSTTQAPSTTASAAPPTTASAPPPGPLTAPSAPRPTDAGVADDPSTVPADDPAEPDPAITPPDLTGPQTVTPDPVDPTPTVVPRGTTGSATVSCLPAAGAPGRFDAGEIISDQVFYDPTAMTAAQVQAFADARGAGCSSSWCLRSMQVEVPAQPADRYCSAVGGGRMAATAAIAAVSAACGVNPQVMLVTLQKESGLVTRSQVDAGSWQAAWGWHCPDTGPGGSANCDPAHAGFAAQLYGMAKQWSRYRVDPQKYTYRAGQVAQIRWNVAESGCGASPVYIRNAATAALYNYTPYQPNAAALASYPGTGDRCSAYGNRNFFVLFGQWFGGTGSGVAASVSVSGGVVTLPGGPDVDPRVAGRQIVAPTAGVARGLAAGLAAVGLPYVWGGGTDGNGPDAGCSRGGGAKNSCQAQVGFDCSGLTAFVLRQAGFVIGGDSSSQRAGGLSVPWQQAQPGDIIGYPGHVAVFLGYLDGEPYMLQAPSVGKQVQIRQVYFSGMDPVVHRYWV